MGNKSLANSYLSAFCLELSMLFAAGITMSDGVLMLSDDEPDKAGKALLKTLSETLENGAPLSAALRESGCFPRYMVNMTQAGEKTGRLPQTLKALSEHYDRQDRLSASIRNAVLYPAILLVMMIVVVLVLIVQVLPIFNDVFNQLGTRMSPMATRLMQFGGWLGDAAVVIAAIAGAIVVIALLSWVLPPFRNAVSRTAGNIFGHRGVFGRIASSRFVSAMTLAVASGLDVEETVEIASAVGGGSNAVDKKHKKCVELLRSGSSLAEAMHQAGIISARDCRMLSLGIRSGMTDTAISEVAGRTSRAAQDEIDSIIGKVEPALVIITSVIIGVILLSVMLPLMSIMTSMG